jgi:hypothetical protein
MLPESICTVPVRSKRIGAFEARRCSRSMV